ncbi:MAG: hypothetical protein ING44_03980 [Telmatospirillum sp.]|nr:hypothetical protein [Telmatospirillum sp.]
MQDSLIYKVKQGRRYWVVRSNEAQFVQNFIQGNVIAIGHLDQLQLPDGLLGKSEDEISSIVNQVENNLAALKSRRGHVISTISQIKAFIEDMSVDDWVISPTPRNLFIGRISSESFVEKKSIFAKPRDDSPTDREMKFNLRRRVQWCPAIERASSAPAIKKTLQANQTVFNVDEHKIAIHHMLFPFFENDENLYSSINITSPENLDNYSISRIFTILSELEVFLKLKIPSERGASKSISEEIDSFASTEDLRLISKAFFMSPGDIWAALPKTNDYKPLWWVIIVYSMIFGNTTIGWDGLIDKQDRKEIAQFVKERWLQRGGDAVRRNLGLRLPSIDVDSLDV